MTVTAHPQGLTTLLATLASAGSTSSLASARERQLRRAICLLLVGLVSLLLLSSLHPLSTQICHSACGRISYGAGYWTVGKTVGIGIVSVGTTVAPVPCGRGGKLR